MAARLLSGLLSLTLLLLPACGGAANPPAPAPDAGAVLEVRNQGFPDMTIYAVTGTGTRVRLGLVGGNSTQRITLPEYVVRGGESLGFLADPIGGRSAPVTEQLFVAPGDTVTLTIPPR